jgi:L-serine dehydratase
MTYHSIQDLINISEENEIPIWQLVCEEDARERQVTSEQSFNNMKEMYTNMKLADNSYDASLRSASGMAGGDGEKIRSYNESGRNLCSKYTSLAMEKAVKMGESNACMKRIVAAPTAGSCGILPAVFISYQECFGEAEERIVQALFVSAGIGAVIAENASIAGASGGCQAEIGTAAAMAAGGLAYLMGGDKQQIANAVALTLKNMLGLACDPVCGLVEVPCIKRNVAGTVNAISTTQLAMAGIESAIPADEVIDSMRRIGNDMPSCLKETGEGGLAVSRTAMAVKEKMTIGGLAMMDSWR